METSSLSLYTWFNSNFMKANSDKRDIVLRCSELSSILIDRSSIESNTKKILLGITIDKDLNLMNMSIISVKKHTKSLVLLFYLHLS